MINFFSTFVIYPKWLNNIQTPQLPWEFLNVNFFPKFPKFLKYLKISSIKIFSKSAQKFWVKNEILSMFIIFLGSLKLKKIPSCFDHLGKRNSLIFLSINIFWFSHMFEQKWKEFNLFNLLKIIKQHSNNLKNSQTTKKFSSISSGKH